MGAAIDCVCFIVVCENTVPQSLALHAGSSKVASFRAANIPKAILYIPSAWSKQTETVTPNGRGVNNVMKIDSCERMCINKGTLSNKKNSLNWRFIWAHTGLREQTRTRQVHVMQGRWCILVLNVCVCLRGCKSVCKLGWLKGSFLTKWDWEGEQGQIITESESCQLNTQSKSRSEFCMEKVKRVAFFLLCFCVCVCVLMFGVWWCVVINGNS